MSALLGGAATDPDRGVEGSAVADKESFLVFQVGALWCAVPALAVKEVVPRSRAVPVPQTPGFVLGLVNLSSRVVVMLDLAALLGAATAGGAGEADGPMRDLVLLSAGLPVGARVDAVVGLVDVPRSELRALPPSDGAAVHVFNQGPNAVTVLDVDRLLAIAESRVTGS